MPDKIKTEPQKYTTHSRLRFRNADGVSQTIEEGDIVSFDDGDKVNMGFLQLIGAIVPYEEGDDATR